MKRIGYTILAVALLALTLGVTAAFAATPLPTSAVLYPRIWNDNPGSSLTTTNLYPSLIEFNESNLGPWFGFANRHGWGFSTDGVTQAAFENNSIFGFAADVQMTGTGHGEFGLRVSPWWSPQVDGVFMLKSLTGEIACWGGRLPFYSFTGAYALTFTKGTVYNCAIIYDPHGLSNANPATATYILTVGGTTYSSGPVPFDQGNPLEDPPHGLWGILDPAYAGGFAMHHSGGFICNVSGDPNCDPVVYDAVDSKFANICFRTPATPTTQTTFGKIKALYK